jgi:3-oxoacyl-[acyl-carrier-protein] synthase II
VGNTAADFWAGVKAGRCGIRPIKAYDTVNQAVKLAAETDIKVSDYIGPNDARKMDRFTQLAVVASREAYKDSGVTDSNIDKMRAGVSISSGIGGLSTTEREHSRGLAKGFDRVSPYFIPMVIPNMAAGRVSIEAGFEGASGCVVTACAGGSHAVGQAFRSIRDGYLDTIICGGAEACVTPLAVGGFTSMQALHLGTDPTRASIPFDKERSGFVLGEGAGILVLEELQQAKSRGAHIYAEISGFGESSDAYHITAPEPHGRGAILSMRNALADAGLSADDIGYINAHGTSTQLNDKSECMAINEVFGEGNDVPVSSTKSMTGHLLGAAGAVEAIICAFAVRDEFIPATINTREVDSDCHVNVVLGEGKAARVKHALSNSLGFGGHNASLIISKYEG